MPRPKRSRADALKAAAARQNAASSIPTHVSSSDKATTTSDDSEGLIVRKANTGTTKPSSFSSKSKLVMSGALPDEEVLDEAGTRYKPVRGKERATLTRIAREKEAASRAVESMRASKTNVVSTPRAKTHDKQSIPAAAAPPATLQVQRSQPEPEEPVPTNTRARNVPMAPMSVRKPMSTPRAEASMLALANFKRRSRARSILGIGNADETASISSDGSFGDLMPDDESTPLPRQMVQKQLDGQLASTQTPEGESVYVTPRTSSSRKRKRGSGEIQVPFSQSLDRSTQSKSRTQLQPDDPLEDEMSEDEPLPQMPTGESPGTPSVPSSVMAPPASSSPVKPNNGVAPANGLLSSPSRRNPGIARAWDRRRKAKNNAKTLDTATLQNLLPKRRQAIPAGEFEIFGSSDGPGDGSDADELSYAPSKRRVAAGRKHLAETNPPAKKTTRRGRGGSRQAAADTKKRTSRTYSRRRDSETENLVASSSDDLSESDNDTSADMTSKPGVKQAATALKKNSKELQQAARKFAQVDRWEMDFEEAAPSSDLPEAR